MSKNALTLSIVIPVFNEQDHLEACLKSIAKQTIKPKQVIVVDNNSTDSSLQIAKKFKFVTVLSEKRQGIGYARDKGFNAVTADIIGRIDADSVLTPNWVEYALMYFKNHPKHLLTGGGYFYDLSLPHFFGWFMEQFAFRANRFIMGHYITWGSNMALSKKTWEDIRTKVHNDPSIHEDMDVAIHAHRAGYVITYHAGWKVGVASRILDRHTRYTHFKYLKMWPDTFRFHKLPRAWMGDVGMYVVYFSWYPIFFSHWLASKVKRLRRII